MSRAWRVASRTKPGACAKTEALLGQCDHHRLYDDTGALHDFAKVTRDLTQRNRLESLEQTVRRMTDFLAMLGHELRDPRASIRNAIGVMQTRALDDPHLD